MTDSTKGNETNVICNIDNCKLEAKGSWLNNRMFITYACTRHFKKYHLTSDKEVPLKPEVRVFHVRELPE